MVPVRCSVGRDGGVSPGYTTDMLRPFHLAFPVHDLAAARGFYGEVLGCPEGRSSDQWIDFDLFDVAEAFKSTPYIADLKPGGKYVAKDMYEAGGVYMLMKTMLAGGLLDGECLTVTGKTLGENIDQVTWNPDQKVIYDVATPITPTCGVVGLRVVVLNPAPAEAVTLRVVPGPVAIDKLDDKALPPTNAFPGKSSKKS